MTQGKLTPHEERWRDEAILKGYYAVREFITTPNSQELLRMIREQPEMLGFGGPYVAATMTLTLAELFKIPNPQQWVLQFVEGMITWLEQGGPDDPR